MKNKIYIFAIGVFLYISCAPGSVLCEENVQTRSFDGGMIVELKEEIDASTLKDAVLLDGAGNCIKAAFCYDESEKTISVTSEDVFLGEYTTDFTKVKYSDGSFINESLKKEGVAVTEVKFKNEHAIDITSLGTSGATKVTAEADFANLGIEKNITTILAAYDSNKLISTDTKEITLSANECISTDIGISTKVEDGYTVKAFFWDTVEDMHPYSNIYALPEKYPVAKGMGEKIYTAEFDLENLETDASSVSKEMLSVIDAGVKDIYYFPDDNTVTVELSDKSEEPVYINGKIKLKDGNVYTICEQMLVKESYKCNNELCSITDLKFCPADDKKALLIISVINPICSDKEVSIEISNAMEDKQLKAILPAECHISIACYTNLTNDITVTIKQD